MLKEMFEQFVFNDGVCAKYAAGHYLYINNSNKMLVTADTTFPYSPHIFEELVHRNMVSITMLTIS